MPLNGQQKIRLLVIPEMFPAHDEDIAGVYTLDYIKSVADYCDTEVFYPRLTGAPGLESTDHPAGFRMHRFHLMNDKKGWFKKVHYVRWFSRALQEAKKLGPFDLIHAHGPLLHGNLAVQLGHFFKVPVVISVHTGPFRIISKNPFYRRMATRSLSKAELTLVVSEHLKTEMLTAGIVPQRIAVSGNPVDDALFALVDRSEQRRQLLFVSRLDEFKGGLRTLKAFHQALPELPEWRLTIAGVGEELEAIEKYIAQYGLGEKVKLTGTLSKESLYLLMNGGDFLVFPSRHETFGLVAQEALCTGMPVIAANTTAPDELIDASMGVKVNPDDIDQIAKAMVHLANNPGSFNGEHIREVVVKRFGLEPFGERLNGFYRKMIEQCAELQE